MEGRPSRRSKRAAAARTSVEMSKRTDKQFGTTSVDDVLSCIICKNLVQHPVLLACLHNACRICAEKDAAKCSSNEVRCPSCCVTTALTAGHDNLLLASRAQSLVSLKTYDMCGFCRQEGKTDVSSSAWCIQCQESLCNRCVAEHKKHNRSHQWATINKTQNWSELASLPPRLCSEHGNVLESVCLTCERPVCLLCVISSCCKEAHDVKQLSDPAIKAKLAKTTEDVNHLSETFDKVSGVLVKHIDLPYFLSADRDVDFDKLRKGRKRMYDAISEASRKAEQALKECYDTLNGKASELQHAAELIKVTASSGIKYMRHVLSSNDVVGVFSQFKILVNRLETLGQVMSTVKEPLESSKRVRVNMRLPSDLKKTIGAWMGPPKRLTDDLCNEVATADNDSDDYITMKERTLEQLTAERQRLQKERSELPTQQLQQQQDRQKQLLQQQLQLQKDFLGKQQLELDKQLRQQLQLQKDFLGKQQLELDKQLRQLQLLQHTVELPVASTSYSLFTTSFGYSTGRR